MQMLDFRMQIACMIVVVYVAYSYMSHKRVQTDFRNNYVAMLITAGVFITLDIVTVYFAGHRDSIPLFANVIFHKMYFICMDSMVFITFRYVTHLLGSQKRFDNKEMRLLSIPFVLSVAAAVFLPMYFRDGVGTQVAFGPAVIALDMNTTAYVIISVYIISKYGYGKVQQKLNALLRAFALLVMTAVFELVYPYMDIYSICVMMLILMVYLAIGDPREYEDEPSEGFNRAAFTEVLDEKFEKNRRFAVLNVVIINWTEIMDATDGKVSRELFEFARKASKMLSTPLYRSAYNSVSYILPIEKSSEFEADAIIRLFGENLIIDGTNISMKADRTILICPNQASDSEHVLENINDMAVNAYRDKVYIDSVTGCLNRNAYENDLIRMNAERASFSSISCIMVDVNGLKATNDTWGHKCGDELIMSTARLLRDTFGTISRIYRIGGDEFLCMISDVPYEMITDKQNKLEDERSRAVLSFGMTVSFAFGSAFLADYDITVQDMVKRADKAMYRDKMRSGRKRK